MASNLVSGVDLKELDPIDKQRLCAFLNFWQSRVCQFLNDASRQFEDDFLRLDVKFERIETALHLLELKERFLHFTLEPCNNIMFNIQLSSIPDNVSRAHENQPEIKAGETVESTSEVQNKKEENERAEESESGTETRLDPKYEKYVKMINMGVPSAAVEQKMNLEGIEPGVIKKILNKETISNPKPAIQKDDQKSNSSFGAESNGDDDSFSD